MWKLNVILNNYFIHLEELSLESNFIYLLRCRPNPKWQMNLHLGRDPLRPGFQSVLGDSCCGYEWSCAALCTSTSVPTWVMSASISELIAELSTGVAVTDAHAQPPLCGQ